MKKLLLTILTALTIHILTSCIGDKEPKELFARVENIMDEHPDSALAMLDSARDQKAAWKTQHQIRYEFLRAKSQNKAYIDFTTDSVMKEVAAYYDKHGTPNEQMEAHYLLGCTYRDMHESPMALSCYLDATEKADTLSDDCDYSILMRIWGQVADEFDRQVIPYKELEALKEYQRYAIKSNDTLNFAIGTELERKAYFVMGDTMKAIEVSERALTIYKRQKYFSNALNSIPFMIVMYSMLNKTNKATELVNYYEQKADSISTSASKLKANSHFQFAKANYYESLNKLDSAIILYRNLVNTAHKYDATKGLLRIFTKMGNADSTIHYSLMKEKIFDKNYSNLHTQAMFNADGMFNYTRNKHIAMEKEIEAKQNKIYLIILCFMSFSVITIALFIFSTFRNRKKEEIKQLKQMYVVAENEYNRARENYYLMVTNFQEYKSKKDQEIQLLKHKKDVSAQLYETQIFFQAISEIKNSNAYEDIMRHNNIQPGCKNRICKKEWKALFNLFKEKMPHLYSKYIQNGNLSEQETYVFLLTILNLSPKTITILLETSAQNVANAKASINNKLFSDTSAKTLYNNIVYSGQKKDNKFSNN